MSKILKLYLSVVFLGTITNAILIFGFLKILKFGYKSAISVYIYSIPGYFIKSLIFSSIIFLLFRKRYLENKFIRNIILWSPLILFVTWYTLIIVFKIESLYVDLSFGYTARFPHFIIQLLSCIIVTVSSLLFIKKVLGNSRKNDLIENASKITMLKTIIISIVVIIVGYNSIFWFQRTRLKTFCNQHSTFNLDEWHKDEKVRYCMLDDIVSKKMFLGKSEKELIKTLGQPFTSDILFDTKYLKFKTSQKSGQYMHWYLTVELKDEIVVLVRKSVD